MPYIHIVGRHEDGTPMSDEETDRVARAGWAHDIFRQCSIGWHEECSDPDGDDCQCRCHHEGGAETREGRDSGAPR